MNIKNWAIKQLQNLVGAYPVFYFLGGKAIYGENNAYNQIKDGYLTNDANFAIVNRIAKSCSLIPIRVYRKKDAKKLRKYLNFIEAKDFNPTSLVKAAILQNDALEPVADNDPLAQFLENPSPIYSKTEFNFGVHALKLLTGNYYVLKLAPDAGANKGKPQELYFLPPTSTYPIVKEGLIPQIVGYQVNFDRVITLPKESVIHGRYFNPEFTINGDQLIGMSPLKAAFKILQRSANETDYIVSSFGNSGISGIVSNESAPMTEAGSEAIGKMKQAFYKEATGIENAKKLLFQAGKVNYTHVGLTPVDMELLKSEIQTFKKLCNIYGISDVLFNQVEGAKYDNYNLAEKQLYTNVCLPLVADWCDQLNKHVAIYYGSDYYITYDISGINALSEDMAKLMEAYAKSPVMIPNVIFESMGIGRIDSPAADKIYVQSNYVPLDSLDIEPPIL